MDVDNLPEGFREDLMDAVVTTDGIEESDVVILALIPGSLYVNVAVTRELPASNRTFRLGQFADTVSVNV